MDTPFNIKIKHKNKHAKDWIGRHGKLATVHEVRNNSLHCTPIWTALLTIRHNDFMKHNSAGMVLNDNVIWFDPNDIEWEII